MIEILKGWGEWIVGIPAIVITLCIYWKQTRTKKLTATISSRRILDIYHEEVKKDLKIFYKDNSVDTIILTSIYFDNNGNTPLRKEDFEGNIIIENSNTDSEIISTNLNLIYPKDINISIAKEGKNKIELTSGLLNSGEKFSLDILSKKEIKLVVSARIADAKLIVKETENKYNFTMIIGPWEAHIYMAAICVGIMNYWGFGSSIYWFSFLTFGLLVLSFIILFFGILSEWSLYRTIRDLKK